jgi:hypothetical protein
MDWMRLSFLSTFFAMSITAAMGAQHNFGISFVSSLGLTGMTRSWAGFTASIPQRGCCLGGGKGKGGHFFRIIMQMWILHTHGLLETGGLTRFLMRFDDERAKETMAGRSCLFFLFLSNFLFSPKMHHDGDAKRIGRASTLFIISSLYYHN